MDVRKDDSPGRDRSSHSDMTGSSLVARNTTLTNNIHGRDDEETGFPRYKGVRVEQRKPRELSSQTRGYKTAFNSGWASVSPLGVGSLVPPIQRTPVQRSAFSAWPDWRWPCCPNRYVAQAYSGVLPLC